MKLILGILLAINVIMAVPFLLWSGAEYSVVAPLIAILASIAAWRRLPERRDALFFVALGAAVVLTVAEIAFVLLVRAVAIR